MLGGTPKSCLPCMGEQVAFSKVYGTGDAMASDAGEAGRRSMLMTMVDSVYEALTEEMTDKDVARWKQRQATRQARKEAREAAARELAAQTASNVDDRGQFSDINRTDVEKLAISLSVLRVPRRVASTIVSQVMKKPEVRKNLRDLAKFGADEMAMRWQLQKRSSPLPFSAARGAYSPIGACESCRCSCCAREAAADRLRANTNCSPAVLFIWISTTSPR